MDFGDLLQDAKAGSAPMRVVPREEYEAIMRATVERSMDKFRGDLLKVLTSLDQRLGGLETHTDTLAQQVGELHRAGAAGRTDTCDRLAALETTSADVARKLRLLQDKMELAEAQHEMDKVKVKDDPPAAPAAPAPAPAATPPPPAAPTPPPPPPQVATPPPPPPPPPQQQQQQQQQQPPPPVAQQQQPQYAMPPAPMPLPMQAAPPQPHYAQQGPPHGYPPVPPPPQYQQQPMPMPAPAYAMVPPPQDAYGGGGGGAVPYSANSGAYGRPGGLGAPPPPAMGGPPSSLDKVVMDVAKMGFHPNQVRAVVQRMLDSGAQVDMNTVLDQLMR